MKPPFISTPNDPFAVQEYLTSLVAQDPHAVHRLVKLPAFARRDGGSSSRGDSAHSSTSPAHEMDLDEDDLGADDNSNHRRTADRDIWLYEHLRRLANDLSHPFVTTLQDHCSRETCPEMKAGEWLYLCAAHSTANEVSERTSIHVKRMRMGREQAHQR